MVAKWALRRETESLIFAAQEHAIQTNAIKGKIDKSQSKRNVQCVVGLMRQLTTL